ncbi:hypothetical protein TNCV_802821 [Trichonephila clavipes]|nr:hypothetical protein TNCV_802821 [Trichonephila clavipes]
MSYKNWHYLFTIASKLTKCTGYESTKYGKLQTRKEKFVKASILLKCPTVSSEEFDVVDDDNVCTAAIMADKGILEFAQSSKTIINTDSDDEKEMNNAQLLFSYHPKRGTS